MADIPTGLDVSMGVALTSNYVSKGVTQTEDKPAVQGYVEASYGAFYVGAWASTVRGVFNPGQNEVEVDVYGGLRHDFDKLSIDIGYAEYLYTSNACGCGELYAKANYAFNDSFSLGAEVYHDVYVDTNWGNLTTEIALPEDFTFSGKVGTFFTSGSKVAWDMGVSRTFMDVATLDLRYYDSNVDPSRFVATISFDLSLSSILSKK